VPNQAAVTAARRDAADDFSGDALGWSSLDSAGGYAHGATRWPWRQISTVVIIARISTNCPVSAYGTL